MKIIAFTYTLAFALIAGASPAFAQYKGPSTPTGYSGPSTIALTTTAQLRASARDNQYARLQGRIVSHDGGEFYTFEDGSGRLKVEIDHDRFPVGQPIGADQRVELLIQVDADFAEAIKFEVEQMRLVP